MFLLTEKLQSIERIPTQTQGRLMSACQFELTFEEL